MSFTKILCFGLFYFVGGISLADDLRLLNQHEDHANWLSYGQGYSNQRYSNLNQVTQSNVEKLTPAWIYQTGILGTFPTNPLVVDGTMFITTPFNHVVALNAVTGEEIWRYKHKQSQASLCCGSHNRGVAWGYGQVFMITADARVIALNASTGAITWDIPMVDPMSGKQADLGGIRQYNDETKPSFDSMTRFAGNMAPIVYDGKVFVGVSGTGYSANLEEAESGEEAIKSLGRPGVRSGLRAFMSAYDVNNGDLLWRWYVTASEGWEGDYSAETSFGDIMERDTLVEREYESEYSDAWQRGGGSIYGSPSIDPELGLIYVGTGNPSPTYADQERPGDNLYTSSVVALDIKTGELRWHHQVVPHDIWGYDVAAPPILFDAINEDNSPRKAVAVMSKSGWLYVLDRESGVPILRSEAFVPQSETMFQRPTDAGVEISPGAAGGANWPPGAYSPETQTIYVLASHRPTIYRRETTTEGKVLNILDFAPHLENWGQLSAIDLDSGKITWKRKTEHPLISGALTTAGRLLFHGQSNGEVVARDVRDGEIKWKFRTGAGVNAPPITYSVEGKQYVAVAAGGHALFGYPLGDAVISFSLPDD